MQTRSNAFILRDRLLQALLALALLCAGGPVLAATLDEVSYAALPGDRVRLILVLSEEVPEPTAFTTDNPARIALDFRGVKSAIASKANPVGVGVVHSFNVIEAGDRLRVVVNLVDSVPFEMLTEGNRIVLNVDSGGGAPEPVARGARAAVATAIAAQKVQQQGRSTAPGIAQIDFRRGEAGEGRVILSLDDPALPIDVREEGQRVVVELPTASLPPELARRMDVVDFATPVHQIEARPERGGVVIVIENSGDYDYLAYQTDDLFTVEVRALTREEKEIQLKERLVYTGERLSLNFQDIEVRAVLQLLADFTGLNMVTSDTVSGRITLRLKNVPWDQALDIILKSKGLSMRRTDTVIMIAPTEELAAREKLELESQQQIEELAPLRSEFIQINYAKATDLAALLKSTDNRLLSERGNVTVDTRTNTLLVQDTGAKLEDIRRLIIRLDVPVRQVLIESRIVIANNDFAKDLGVRFGFTGANKYGNHEVLLGGGQPGHLDGTAEVDKGPFLASATSGLPFNASINDGERENLLVNLPVTDPTGAVNVLIGKVGSYLLQLELSAMQTEGKGEVVSSPRVITSDQTKASIKQGFEIPYQQATSSGATSIAFKEAVLKLDVTPHITPDDRIRMDLEINKDSPDFSRVVGGVPPLDTRKVQTTVLVDNGETVVLGGVFERTKTESIERVPFFGDLPYLGVLFRKTEHRDENNELLIFVTPKILKETLGVR